MTAIVQALFGPSCVDLVDRAIELRQQVLARLARRPLGVCQKRLLTRLRRAKRPTWLVGRDGRVAVSLAARGLLVERDRNVFEAAR